MDQNSGDGCLYFSEHPHNFRRIFSRMLFGSRSGIVLHNWEFSKHDKLCFALGDRINLVNTLEFFSSGRPDEFSKYDTLLALVDRINSLNTINSVSSGRPDEFCK